MGTKPDIHDRLVVEQTIAVMRGWPDATDEQVRGMVMEMLRLADECVTKMKAARAADPPPPPPPNSGTRIGGL